MKIIAIVQARMGSKRLPGKVMLEVKGKPLIGYLIDRLKQVNGLDGIVVAIPLCDADSPLQHYVNSRGVTVYCGNEENDLCARFLGVLDMEPCDAFVRICADSPLIEPQVVNLVVDRLRHGATFFSTAGMKMFGPGNSVEGCIVSTYRMICSFADQTDREHAGFPWFYRENVKTSGLVDTPEDFERVKSKIEND